MDAAAFAELLKQLTEFAKNFGASGVVLLLGVLNLFLGAYAARCVWAWFKPHGEQIIKAHVGLVDTLKEESPKQTAAMQVVSESVSQLASLKGGEKVALHHMSRAIEEIPENADRRERVKVHTTNMREALE